MKIAIELTRAQWQSIMHAVDNGALAGDTELCETMFPHKGMRKAFIAAVKTIADRIGSNYDTEGYV